MYIHLTQNRRVKAVAPDFINRKYNSIRGFCMYIHLTQNRMVEAVDLDSINITGNRTL